MLESWTAAVALEVHMNKIMQVFALELWTVIKDNSIKNSVRSKDVLKLADHCCCSRDVKSDNFQPPGIVVNHHHIVLDLGAKEIRPQVLSWSTR